MMKRLFALLFMSFVGWNAALAQSTPVEMADSLRASGKIYVVVAVIAIIFLGLIIYLFSLDRRIKKIENQN